MSISKVEDRRGHNINDENINSQLNIHSRVNSLEITDIRKNHDHLVINPARGSWAVLDDNSLSVFKSMKNVILADLQKKSKIKMEELIKFSRDLYNYGLITVDDQVKVNPITQDLSFSMLVLKLTNKCNLLCTYCYNEGLDATDEGISMATAFNSIDSSLDACNEGVVIVLHGGEPLLQFKRLQEIVEYGEKQSREYSKKIIFSLQTNATLLNRTNVEYIKEHEIGLGISFDGPAVINDATRVYRNGMPSSEKIMRGIQLIKDYALPVNIITVVTKFNDKNLAEIVLYLQDMGCSSVQFSYFFGQGLGATAIEMAPNPEYVVYSLKEILKKIVTKEISTIEVNEIMSKIDSILLHNKRDICHRSPCGAGKDMMTIFPSGKIYACDCLVPSRFRTWKYS